MLIILDRDGVINEDSPDFIKTPAEWIPIPHSLEAIAKLNRAGHIVAIASNQSGIGRALFTEEDLQQIHRKMINELAVHGGHFDAILYCPHNPDAHCNCRKPKPGLLITLAEQFNIDFSNALLVGDAERDIQAAIAVHCPAVLVRTGKGMQTIEKNLLSEIPIYDNLASVVEAIMKNSLLPTSCEKAVERRIKKN